jgi:hypothetical protein
MATADRTARPQAGMVAMRVPVANVDPAEVRRLAELVARLSVTQQRVVDAVAEGFRAGWLQPAEWERYWRHSDLTDEVVVAQALTWLVRRRQAAVGPLAGQPAR